ncbi:MAG: hypothetical protein UZ17_ACD001002273 [Acidobacteria bacterium OLB17]|nr:MAG: hypothetical protein UZ17_ACD001002273 [Acidobacteria bacterium OLB17]
MNELDSTWAAMLEAAIRNAEVSGRTDIADYLHLKASNDLLRTTATAWLLDSFIEAAMEAARHNAAIKVEREEPYQFSRGSGRMDGSRLIISFGVRCLEVKAGWPRTPSSGILRGNGPCRGRHLTFSASHGITARCRLSAPTQGPAGSTNADTPPTSPLYLGTSPS